MNKTVATIRASLGSLISTLRAALPGVGTGRKLKVIYHTGGCPCLSR